MKAFKSIPPPSQTLRLVPSEVVDIEKLFLKLNESNLELTYQKVSKLMEAKPSCPLLYEFYITQFIYMSYFTQKREASLYVLFLNSLSNIKNLNFTKLLKVLTIYLCQINTYESGCLLKEINKNEMIPSSILYYVKNIINITSQETKEADLLEILRNDDLEELQEMSTQSSFNFNQVIDQQLYEKYSFIKNQKEDVSIIDFCAFFGSIKCFKFLLINGSNVQNALKYAIAGGNLEIIHLCIQNDSTFNNALEIAIEFHRNDIFHYFYVEKIEKRKNLFVNKDLNELGMQCLKHTNYKILSFLEKEGLSKLNLSLQEAAIRYNNLPFIQSFYEGKIIRKDLFLDLLQNGNPIVVKWLLQNKGIKIENGDFKEKTFFWASKKNHKQLIKYLLKQGININTRDNNDGQTALLFALYHGHVEIIKFLLEQDGIDINSKDDLGNTALILASKNGNTEIVKLLLEQKGIDINAKDKDGATALIKASENGNTEIVKLLLEQEGIDINAKNKYENTALILASAKCHTEILKLLLEQEGIDINAQNKYGITALMSASHHRYTEVVKLLLEHEGIDINAKDNDGNTALILVSCYTKVQPFLRKKGVTYRVKDFNLLFVNYLKEHF